MLIHFSLGGIALFAVLVLVDNADMDSFERPALVLWPAVFCWAVIWGILEVGVMLKIINGG